MFPNPNQQMPYPYAQNDMNGQPQQQFPNYEQFPQGHPQMVQPPMANQPMIPGPFQPVQPNYPQMPGYQQPMPGYQQPMPGYQQPMPGYQQPMPMMQQYQQPNYGVPEQPQMTPYPVADSYNQENETESDDDDDDEDEEDEYDSDDNSEWEAFRGTPTLYAAEDFDPEADAAVLRKAMKGFGTDEDAIINVLCHRSCGQRQAICEAFEKKYEKSLIEKIKSETSGKFEQLLVALLTSGTEFYCKEIKDPMSGSSKKVLVEILCTLYNNEIEAMKSTFSQLYGQDLEAAILGSSDSDTFKNMMVALCVADRDESGEIDIDAAKDDARELADADDPFEYEGIFQDILCNRNYDQLKTILREYQVMTGKPFRKLIKKTFSGDELQGMMYILRCINNKAEFFAHQLHKSMDGLGTNDHKLIRLIVTRCEIDMVDIKAAFERMFEKSLKSCIKGDCSGDYKHALYALIDEKRS